MDNPDPPVTESKPLPPPPPPPKGPECQIQCSSCGFTADESEFKTRHKSCTQGIITVMAVALGVIALWGIIALTAAGKIS